MAYFPNGTAGEVLGNQCADCHLSSEAPCPILWVQMTYNYSQLDSEGERTAVSDVMDCLVNDDGICQMKPVIDEHYE